MANKNKTAFVGMSGGVDSSVAAGILVNQGYKVIGVHLRCWNIDGCADQDVEDARRAAETLSIPFYVFDFEAEYKERVVDYMVREYRSGRTPNPDVMCNNQIKFGLFFERARKMGADYVATGHYVLLRNQLRNSGRNKKNSWPILCEARDKDKDQSYFLWTLDKNQLSHCLFPLGNLIKKTQVRNLAKKFNLPNADKKDSQGICFLGHVNLPGFLEQFIPPKKGKVLDASGKVLGTHKGAHNFTLGQRRGLGIGGLKEPQFVVAKDIKKNTVTLVPQTDPRIYSTTIELSDLNFFIPPSKTQKVLARIRYRQPLFKATLKKQGSKYLLLPDKPEKFVAPGQSAVFYGPKLSTPPASRPMLGGGVINTAS